MYAPLGAAPGRSWLAREKAGEVTASPRTSPGSLPTSLVRSPDRPVRPAGGGRPGRARRRYRTALGRRAGAGGRGGDPPAAALPPRSLAAQRPGTRRCLVPARPPAGPPPRGAPDRRPAAVLERSGHGRRPAGGPYPWLTLRRRRRLPGPHPGRGCGGHLGRPARHHPRRLEALLSRWPDPVQGPGGGGRGAGAGRPWGRGPCGRLRRCRSQGRHPGPRGTRVLLATSKGFRIADELPHRPAVLLAEGERPGVRGRPESGRGGHQGPRRLPSEYPESQSSAGSSPAWDVVGRARHGTSMSTASMTRCCRAQGFAGHEESSHVQRRGIRVSDWARTPAVCRHPK
jgi:hypothetical protein